MENKVIKILAVDANQNNLTILKALITEAFPEAVFLTAKNGQSGLEIAVEEEPDVILLDIIMPGMDGYEVCRKLKADKELCNIPILFITAGKNNKESRIKAVECGAEAFLTKPIDEIELTAQIGAMLKISAANNRKRDEKQLLAAQVEEKTRELKASNEELLLLVDAAKRDQALMQSIFDSIPGYLYVYDESGRLIKWNKKHETMTGYTGAELSDMTLEKWFDQEDIAKVNAAVHDVFEKGYGEVEAPLILKNGEKMMIRSSGVPLILDGQKYFAGIGVDITEQTLVQETLLKSQRIAHLGTWRLNLATNQVVWSEELYKMYGFDPALPPPPFTEHMKLFTPESWDKLSSSLERTRTIGIPYELELETVKMDGSNGWMWVHGEANKDAKGNIISLWGAAQDITERKKAEEELSESQAILIAGFENSLAGIAIADAPDGKLRYVNKAGLLIRDKSEEELVKNIDIHNYVASWKIMHFDGTPYAEDEVPLARAVLYGETCREEFVIQRDNYEDRYVLANAAPIKDANNKIIAGIVVFLDVTEKRQADEKIRKQNELFTSLLKLLPVGVFMVDAADGKPLVVNDMGTAFLGSGILSDANEHNLSEVYKAYKGNSNNPYPTAEMPVVLGMKGISAHIDDMVVERPDGTRILLEVFGTPVKDKQGTPWASLVTFMDITERTRTYNELNEALKFNQDMISSANEGIIVYDNELRYRIWNDYMEQLTGLSAKEVIGRKAEEVFPWLKENGVIDSLERALHGEKPDAMDFPFNNAKTKQLAWARDNSGPLYNSKGEVVGVMGIVQNISERKKAEDNLIFMSYHDQLTGLYNRRFFEEELKRIDTKANLPISIIMCDINGLKYINDSFGYSFGDELLRKAADTIQKACRADGIVSRLGGDEFVIILPKTDAEETVQIANRIMEFASKAGTEKIELSISFGYDTKKTEDQSMTEIVANTENNMYRNKLYEHSSIRSKTIDIIMNTLFEKSDRESQHSNRVSSICQAIASKMNFDKDDVNKIRIAGLVHDIGKMGIDERILNKAGILSNFEWEQMKRHPEVGWRILSSVNEFSELAKYILHHHERWDGRGYPHGLKGQEISLEARIITVADAYDAMTSERSYRSGVSQAEAIKELKKCSGTQFDPEIVDVFVNQVLPYNSNFGGEAACS